TALWAQVFQASLRPELFLKSCIEHSTRNSKLHIFVGNGLKPFHTSDAIFLDKVEIIDVSILQFRRWEDSIFFFFMFPS
ncbi:MAG TPA: hypothetical protein VK568_16220, partial [Thermodesulfobacteriota bacterium]|nr:hypothetical protein [Thermodesulfobacteriota bacterium]